MADQFNVGLVKKELSVQNLVGVFHAHSTLTEGIVEAAADVIGKAINT